MSSYHDRYKRRVLLDGTNAKENEESIGRRNFDYMLQYKTSPTVHDIILSLNSESEVMNKYNVTCEISNVTNNDQDKYDEKYVKFSMLQDITYGSYVKWNNAEWLILFEENNPFQIYRTFTMRRCNNEFNFKYNGVLYKIPQVVKNLTLYSDGLDDEIYISKPDAQRQILMADNGLTSKIKIGTRVMLTNATVYMITHIDDFSHPGVRTMICKQDTINSLDDLESNIAYNEISEVIEVSNELTSINGKDVLYVGDFTNYSILNPTTVDTDYSITVSESFITITRLGDFRFKLECNEDARNIGKTFELSLFDKVGNVDTKIITVKGLS